MRKELPNPWGHNREIITKLRTVDEVLFCMNKTIENNWSGNVLLYQIGSKFHERQKEIGGSDE